MARLKYHKSLSKLLKKMAQNFSTMMENMETPATHIWSANELPTPIYSTLMDSGYISHTSDKKLETDTENNKMVQAKSKLTDAGWKRGGMDFELASFWMSAESPYWPCKKRFCKK